MMAIVSLVALGWFIAMTIACILLYPLLAMAKASDALEEEWAVRIAMEKACVARGDELEVRRALEKVSETDLMI